MRVVQLGCGITGLVCAEYLEKNPKVDELVLADMRADAAEGMARRVKSDKISVVKTDASDKNALKKLLRGTDLVVCSVTSELLGKIGEAAIGSGVNYLDFSPILRSVTDILANLSSIPILKEAFLSVFMPIGMK